MSTLGVARELGEVFLWIGIAGVAIAILCAMVLIVALARSAAGVVGGAVAVWIGATLLSLASGFSGQWIPTLTAGGALVLALVLGGVVRIIMRAIDARPKPERVVVDEVASDRIVLDRAAAPAVIAPVTQKLRPVSISTVASESIR